MKTSHISDNFDLCHPILGCSENKNSAINNISSSISLVKNDLSSYSYSNYNNQHLSTPSTSSVANITYGNTNSDSITSKYENNANEIQLRNQQRQQQEQNKKRKRETGE